MNPTLRSAYGTEMAQAKRAFAANELGTSFAHLQRAHVLGQAFVGPHCATHAGMLRIEWRRRRPIAALGQLVRLVLGALGSAIGVVPTGNTGGSDVNMFRRMPIAPELQSLIDGRAPKA